MNHPLFRSSLLLLVLAVASGCPSPTTSGGLATPKPTRSKKPTATSTPPAPLATLGAASPSPTAPAATQTPSAQPRGALWRPGATAA